MIQTTKVTRRRIKARNLNIASAWHTDLYLGREIEVVTDMMNRRLAGFHEYQPTLGSFVGLFAHLRRERIIPVCGSSTCRRGWPRTDLLKNRP